MDSQPPWRARKSRGDRFSEADQRARAPPLSRRAIDPEHKIHLYRIAQEATTNAIKHAGASRILVSLSASGDRIELRIEDDGKGFDPTAASGGLGLATMRQRAALIGAELDCTTAPGGGTRLGVAMARKGTP